MASEIGGDVQNKI